MSEIQECVLYRGMEHGEILLEMAKLMDALSDDRKDPGQSEACIFPVCRRTGGDGGSLRLFGKSLA